MLEQIKEFLTTGYNLYYVIAGVVIVLVAIIIIAVSSKNAKTKKILYL